MIRCKTKGVSRLRLLGSQAAMLLAMVLTPALVTVVISVLVMGLALAPFAAAPSAMTPMTHPELLIAPADGEDWPVLENPDQEDIMVVNLVSRPIAPLA